MVALLYNGLSTSSIQYTNGPRCRQRLPMLAFTRGFADITFIGIGVSNVILSLAFQLRSINKYPLSCFALYSFPLTANVYLSHYPGNRSLIVKVWFCEGFTRNVTLPFHG